MNAYINGDVIRIEFEYRPDRVALVRTLMDRKFHSVNGRKYWSVPANGQCAAEVVTKLGGAGWQISESVVRLADEFTSRLKIDQKKQTKVWHPDLRSYQNAGVSFEQKLFGRCIIGDDPGTGKTPQFLVWLSKCHNVGRVLVVAPANVTYKWLDEFARWAPKIKASVYERSKDDIPTAQAIITSYTLLTLRYYAFVEMSPAILCLDECHAIKNPKAQRTRAARLVAAASDHVICMSGTIFENRPIELFNSLQIVDPQNWKSRESFGYRYCGGFDLKTGKRFEGASNQAELKMKLRSVMLRRTKQEVLKDLPPLQRTRIAVPINMKEYLKIEKEVLSAIRALDPEHRGYFLAVIEKMGFLRKAIGEFKVPAVIEFATDLLDQTGSNVKLVVYCHHRNVARRVTEALISYEVVMIDGDVPQKKRGILREKYQMPGGPRVLVMTTAGSEGVDLFGKLGVDSSRIIIAEQEWNPAKEEQAEARLHRRGQANAVEAYYIVAGGTIDDTLEEIKSRKREWFRQIAGDDVEKMIVRHIAGIERIQ